MMSRSTHATRLRKQIPNINEGDARRHELFLIQLLAR